MLSYSKAKYAIQLINVICSRKEKSDFNINCKGNNEEKKT